jgi:glycosyltransferase involved in cell wall biosynthesis
MMGASGENKYARMMATLTSAPPRKWKEIAGVIEGLRDSIPPSPSTWEGFLRRCARGTAFLTFDYGVDGVSIEIAKYAQSLEDLYAEAGAPAIHLIGGDFYPQADTVMKPGWRRFRIEGINGWSKWAGGKWFGKLFYEEMPAGSAVSDELAVEMYAQAASIAEKLGAYIVENDIALLIPVNVSSNPGNLALGLATAITSEGLGLYVLNSNHDFFWDGGKPVSEREAGEEPGVRDHFFKNVDNRAFFSLFESLFPWNGRRWLQVNINHLQSATLIEKHHFSPGQVFELSTAVSKRFFEEYGRAEIKSARLRMGHILSDGEAILHPMSIEAHLQGLGEWMQKQRPCVLGRRAGLRLDPQSENLIYLLQPTRVVARKRIGRNFELIEALLQKGALREAFEADKTLQLVMHITGPTPIEHQADLETALKAYVQALDSVPGEMGDRLFTAFSVGNEDHPAFREKGFKRLTIEEIYRMATAVLFPSETEGRGLPIVESSASGVPIVCSRYQPEEVFAVVVGEGLAEEKQIQYTLFPEGAFTQDFLDEVAELFLHPERFQARQEHNRNAVRLRYSREALTRRFEELLKILHGLGNPNHG